MANPAGLKLSGGVFPPQVYASFPTMLRTLACCYMLMAAIGAALVTPAPPARPAATGGRKRGATTMMSIDRSFGEAVRSPTLWLLWSLVLMAAPAGLATAAVYKTLALSSHALADDGQRSRAPRMPGRARRACLEARRRLPPAPTVRAR